MNLLHTTKLARMMSCLTTAWSIGKWNHNLQRFRKATNKETQKNRSTPAPYKTFSCPFSPDWGINNCLFSMIFQRFSISPSWSRSFSCGSDPHEFLDGFLGFRLEGAFAIQLIWLVVSTHLKNISQIGNHPQVGVKIKNIWNHHLVIQLNMGNCPKTFWTLPPTKKPSEAETNIIPEKVTISIMETSKFQGLGTGLCLGRHFLAAIWTQGCLARWWLNQPLWKILVSQIGSSPQGSRVKIKNIWVATT